MMQNLKDSWSNFVLKRGRKKSLDPLWELTSAIEASVVFFEQYPDILRAFRMIDLSMVDDSSIPAREKDVLNLIRGHKDAFCAIDIKDLASRYYKLISWIVEVYDIHELEGLLSKYDRAVIRLLAECDEISESSLPSVGKFEDQIRLYQAIVTRMSVIPTPHLAFDFMGNYLAEITFKKDVRMFGRLMRLFSYEYKNYLRAMMIIHFRLDNQDYEEGLFDSYAGDLSQALESLKMHLNLVFISSVGLEHSVYKDVNGFGSSSDRLLGYTMISKLRTTDLYKNGVDRDYDADYSLTALLGGGNVFELKR